MTEVKMYGTPLYYAYMNFIKENGGGCRLLYLRGEDVVQGQVAVVVMGPHGFRDAVRVLFGRFEPKTFYAHQHNGEIISQIVE